jgi:DNA-binding transcriptional LysR family regulator
MSKLPDLEGLAIFAKIVQMRSFAGAAIELRLSKSTVSKAISRLEVKLGTLLFNRTSRQLSLTEAGRQLSVRAAHILAEGEAAEDDTRLQSGAPRGLLRLAAPMSFGNLQVAPLMPEFLATYPELSVDLHLSDEKVDMIGSGFDAAIRIAASLDPSLRARTLCDMPRFLLGAPSYLEKFGRPKHPVRLSTHKCITYTLATPETWHFRNRNGETATVQPSGPLRVNNGDAMLPVLLAGTGLGVLPEFFVRGALSDGRLERLLPQWSLPLGAAYWVTPPGGLRPKRVDLLRDFLIQKLTLRDKAQKGPR